MTDVLTCSLTDAGAGLATRLPFEHQRGDLMATVADRWATVDGLVLICATGIAVAAVAPRLGSGANPGVVCVDDQGRWAIALTGGHAGGANALARQVATILGAEAVITTATDGAALGGLDTLTGFRAEGDIAGITRLWLDGHPPALRVDAGLKSWPIPHALAGLCPGGTEHPVVGPIVAVTDSDREAGAVEVRLRPPSLVIGVGSSTGADPDGLQRLVRAALAGAGLHPDSVAAVATLDRKATEPAIVALAASLGVPLRSYPSAVLASVAVPNPSAVVAAIVGTPSVCEAAALVAAGPGATLPVAKHANADATVAISRRRRPSGHLAVVGLGPGDIDLRTPAAATAVRHADTVIGYGPYVDLVGDLLEARHQVVRSPIGAESERCRRALRLAADGRRVALVCSGDPGVYAMATLVLELAPAHGDPPVTVVPGVTAALSAAAVLGAPLGHDHAAISLSDLLTPWEAIRTRVEAVATADFVVSLYNPRSQRRTTQLGEAVAILAGHRPPSTPVAVVTNAGRPGQRVLRTTIAALDPADVGMLSLVIVGATTTRWIGDRMVTPRGYER